uniref:Uncharacterized protein n=1 Tax=Arundo donax TaxID=35708 RepID=A0A0A8YXI6_ARUDO
MFSEWMVSFVQHPRFFSISSNFIRGYTDGQMALFVHQFVLIVFSVLQIFLSYTYYLASEFPRCLRS